MPWPAILAWAGPRGATATSTIDVELGQLSDGAGQAVAREGERLGYSLGHPCDIYGECGTPCVGAYSTTRDLTAKYGTPAPNQPRRPWSTPTPAAP